MNGGRFACATPIRYAFFGDVRPFVNEFNEYRNDSKMGSGWKHGFATSETSRESIPSKRPKRQFVDFPAIRRHFFDMDLLEKARENLAAAKICFDNGHFNACANRAYYSALHAAITALSREGIRRSKIDHARVQADFSGELIKRRKIYPIRFRSYLSDMQYIRDKADYTLSSVSSKMAKRILSKLEEWIELIETEVSK